MTTQKDLTSILKKTFLLQDFREGQEEIIQSVIDGNDTMVYMPTGGGKSLVYQLPTLVRNGMTIVISPLISLMKDQVDKLNHLGLRAELINSTISSADIKNILEEVEFANTSRNPIKFLYIAPERLGSSMFTRAITNTRIAMVAIDEAHCISQWGHDFRPSYMKIKGFIESLSSPHSSAGQSSPQPSAEKVPSPHPSPKGRGSYVEYCQKEYNPRYIVELSRNLRQSGTEAEEILWEVLRNKKLHNLKFRRQHPIGRYIADFYCHELQLSIELDGSIHQQTQEYDTIRDEIIQQHGIKVLRFANEDVVGNIEKIIDAIIHYIPLPLGEVRGGQGDDSLYSQKGKEERNFPIVALTATATHKVREDIKERLGITEYQEFIKGFDRKNIVIVVREISAKEDKQKKVADILNKTPGVGIIYCSSRKNVVELTEYLQKKGLKIGSYKGDMSPEVREAEQNKFMNGEYKAIVATNAFGMGIDKSDIRFVIHYNLPGSIENYYQEVGRAGRDGEKSFGVVLASYGDTKIQEFFIDNTYPTKEEVLKLYDTLYQDVSLGKGQDTIVQKTYYTLASESGVDSDMKIGSAIKILEKYGILRRGVDPSQTQDDFRGRGVTLVQEKRNHGGLLIDWKRQEKLKEEAYYKLEQIKKLLFYPSCRKRFILDYFGDVEDLEKLGDNCGVCDFCLEKQNLDIGDIEKLIPQSMYEIVLETVQKYDEKFGVMLLSKVLTGSSERRIIDWNLDIYEHYGTFREYALESIAAIFEALIQEGFLYKTGGKYPVIGLSDVGMTSIRKGKYLKEALQELNTYVMMQSGSDILKKTKASQSSGKNGKKSQPKGETYKQTLELLHSGKTLKEISKERELGVQTIENHVIKLYESGEYPLLKILDIIELSDLQTIKQTLQSDTKLEGGELKPIKEKLEQQGHKKLSYFDIKITLSMMEKGDL